MLQLGPQTRSGVARALCYLALIAIAGRMFDPGSATISRSFRISAIQALAAKGQDTSQQKAGSKPALALNKTATDLSFVFSLALLRFDLKQNLRTWPILANDIARSPPAPH